MINQILLEATNIGKKYKNCFRSNSKKFKNVFCFLANNTFVNFSSKYKLTLNYSGLEDINCYLLVLFKMFKMFLKTDCFSKFLLAATCIFASDRIFFRITDFFLML